MIAAGDWGRPPVDEYGRPLYGDVFAAQMCVPFIMRVLKAKRTCDIVALRRLCKDPTAACFVRAARASTVDLALRRQSREEASAFPTADKKHWGELSDEDEEEVNAMPTDRPVHLCPELTASAPGLHYSALSVKPPQLRRARLAP